MPKVLVTGAAGFVGRAAVDAFRTAGWQVRAAVRSRPTDVAPDIEWAAVGDIRNPGAWSGTVSGVDCVLHLAARVHVGREPDSNSLDRYRAINVEATRRLAHEALAAGVRRFIFLSSIGVNGQRTPGPAFTENDAPRPELPYAFSKLEAESALRSIAASSGVELVIVRPPLVYGPDAPGNFRRLASWVSSGLPLPLAGVCNRRSFISVQNLVSALVRCADHPRAANETFLVADGEDVSTPALVMKIAAALGREARLWSVPQPLLALLARLGHRVIPLKQLIDSLAVDSSRIRQRLDWKPPLGFDEGLRIALAGSPLARRR
ncbi:MAG TPA: NAD-dependent epimerase/dehydratase family protein [Burkholderiales bacterium]|nr:NAD-dependent epimerase/dehydratase family protein [Burkholderiales bacterium]